MIRTIIKIDEGKCDGCGSCVDACEEGAIKLVNGKAKLVRDDYCDGLGNCLPVCPTGAISFVEREAAAFDEAAVQAAQSAAGAVVAGESVHEGTLPCGCPSAEAKTIHREPDHPHSAPDSEAAIGIEHRGVPLPQTHLNQWPAKIKLVPPNAPFLHNAHLLVAADCAAYAYGAFHGAYMKDRITLIGCPKLDDCDYSIKLTAILRENEIRSVTVVRMSVPCCAGIVEAVKAALRNSGKLIPWQFVIITPDGQIVED